MSGKHDGNLIQMFTKQVLWILWITHLGTNYNSSRHYNLEYSRITNRSKRVTNWGRF